MTIVLPIRVIVVEYTIHILINTGVLMYTGIS